jgi:uncharacterized protein YqhQ
LTLVLVSVVVFLAGSDADLWRLASRILLLPVLAGIA